DVTEEDLCTCFWTMLMVNVVLFSVAFAGAPLFAAFFKEPRLIWVLRLTSVGFLISAFSSVQSTILAKRLQFGFQAIVDALATLIGSGLAIFFALVLELEYWSLVFSALIATFVASLIRIRYVRWRPRLRFSRASFRFQFRYGMNGLGESAVGYFHQNIDYLLVGRFLGAATLGLYEFAYRIPHLVYVRLARPVGGMVFPILSKVQTSDERLAAGYMKTATYIALIVFPMVGGLAILAGPAVAVLWGD
ncbi:unnamed protein product, partial [marine sediment metagenome]